MTVSVSLQMTGDLESLANRKVALDIIEAVKGVLKQHEQEFSYKPLIGISEIQTHFKNRLFTLNPDTFRSNGSSTTVTLSTAFHSRA